jgi:hypothetical protein
MDYFDRVSRGSAGHSKSEGGIQTVNKSSRVTKQGSEIEGKETFLNNNSSTAMGTNMHG